MLLKDMGQLVPLWNKPEDLNRSLLRIDNPVFPNAVTSVRFELRTSVTQSRGWGEYLNHQVWCAFDPSLQNVAPFVQNDEQVGF